jgi:iron complex outermembrane receptor protein
LAEVSADFDLNNGWSTAFGGMVYHSTGDIQTPGWNRLTQDLIDHGTYVTGRDTTLVDADGNGRMTPGEVGFYPFGSALYIPYYGFPATDANHTLDTGVGTTKLDPRTVYVSAADFSKTWTNTLYFDVAKRFDDDSVLKLQLFYDDQENKRFVSYGYPAWFDSSVWEARASYAFKRDVRGGQHRARSSGPAIAKFEGAGARASTAA